MAHKKNAPQSMSKLGRRLALRVILFLFLASMNGVLGKDGEGKSRGRSHDNSASVGDTLVRWASGGVRVEIEGPDLAEAHLICTGEGEEEIAPNRAVAESKRHKPHKTSCVGSVVRTFSGIREGVEARQTSIGPLNKQGGHRLMHTNTVSSVASSDVEDAPRFLDEHRRHGTQHVGLVER